MKKMLTNNLLYKITALIFAFIFWLVVVNVSDPSITTEISGIQVKILNAESITNQDLVYTVVSGETATIKVKGPRTIVDKLDASDFVATADFGEISITNAVPINVELSPENEKNKKSVEIIDKTSSMLLELESIQSKSFDVEVAYSGEPASGYVVGTQEVSDSFVEVSAPNSILRKIKKVVLSVDLTNKSADFTVSAQPTLLDEEGNVINLDSTVTIDKDAINVKVIMNRIKRVSLNFSTTGVPASGYELIGLQYSPTEVSIRGTEEDVQGIDAITVPETLININNATGNVTVNIDISSYLPEGVVLNDESQKVIQVTAQIQEPASETFTINSTNVELRNLPSGYQSNIVTNPITVTLHGGSTAINAIDQNTLIGYIDLTGGVEGNNDKTLTILNLPEGVSLVSEVRITVLLSKIPEVQDETTSN